MGQLFFYVILWVCLSNWSVAQASESPRPPQFILISFDGSYTNQMWQATREQALASNAKVTHFISGVDFLIGSGTRRIPGATDAIYTPPRYTGGRRSDIGFGGTRAMLEERIRQVTKSVQAGMEIGGHGNSHFDGSGWSKQDWTYEFNWFHKLLLEVFRINSLNPESVGVTESTWLRTLLPNQMRSFRAPYLGRGAGLWQALSQSEWSMLDNVQEHRFTYDASDVSTNPAAWPQKSPGGFWYFRMATIPVKGMSRNILSMDYNFYAAHSDNPSSPKEKPEKVAQFEAQMLDAYMSWFMRNYYGNRAPIHIGHHFSTWNRGAYWKALKRFMQKVCHQPEVKCVTGQELVQYLERLTPQQLQANTRGDFDRSYIQDLNIAWSKPVTQQALRAYPWQSRGYAYLPSRGFTKEIRVHAQTYWVTENGQRLHANVKHPQVDIGNTEEGVLDLVTLARQGVYRLNLIVEEQGEAQAYPWYIEWDPQTNHAQLIEWQAPLIKACDSQEAHTEVFNEADIEDSIAL